MDKNQKEMFIKKFITEVKNNYTGYVVLGYEFDEQVQQYNIWHNRKDLQLDKEFKTIVGKLIKDILFDNRIFDFYFGYDSEKEYHLMFPYIREHIATITQKAGVKPISLPPINIQALIKNKNENERI